MGFEFKFVLEDLGEITPQFADLATQKFERFDADKSGSLELNEVVECLYDYMSDEEGRKKVMDKNAADVLTGKARTIPAYGVEKGSEEDEEEDIPEDLAGLPHAQQQRRIILRSLWMMLLGTFIVLFVSDPFVDVLNVWAKRIGIGPFYVSFVVAPFASNASELLSAYVYAAKKTQAAITTSLSTLIGAACMNNTFVLSIFFALIYFQGLAWKFTAETISIMAIQWMIGAIAMQKVQSLFTGIIVLGCYPLCLALVYCLEEFAGLD